MARMTYDNPRFWYYLNGSNPSIHIVVKRGHVTLAGTGDTEGDRTLICPLVT